MTAFPTLISLPRAALGIALALALFGCAPMPLDREGGRDPQRVTDPNLILWQDGNEQWVYPNPNTIPTIAPQNWSYEKDAIQIVLKAQPQLNLYEGKIHTAVVQIFQLSDQRGFNDMRKTEAGLQYLLATKAEALGADVIDYRETVLMPGGETTLRIDRQERARYMGIIAGYYDLKRGGVSRLISFPAIDDTPEPEYGLFDAITFRMFADEPDTIPPRPGRLLITMTLGARGISEATIVTH